jgi:hypothetical protein
MLLYINHTFEQIWTNGDIKSKIREFENGKLDGAYGNEFVEEIRH